MLDYAAVDKLPQTGAYWSVYAKRHSVDQWPFAAVAHAIVESEGLGENSKGANVTDPGQEREWPEAPDPEARLSRVLETTEALSQGSTVDGLLWNSGSPE